MILRIILSFLLLFYITNLHSQNILSNNEIAKDYKPKLPTVYYQSSINNFKSVLSISAKSVIDSTAIKQWIKVDEDKVAISADGNYYMYNIINQPIGSNTLVLQSVHHSWRKELIGVNEGFFSSVRKQFVYLINDTLVFLNLGTNVQSFISHVSQFKVPTLSNGQWLFYQTNVEGELIILNILTGDKQYFDHISDYRYDEKGSMILLKIVTTVNGEQNTDLKWVNLSNERISNIWSSYNHDQLISYSIDEDHGQLCFLLLHPKKISDSTFSIWYYQFNMEMPFMVIESTDKKIEEGLAITASSSPSFTKDGRYLVLQLSEIDSLKSRQDAVQVDIWHYQDTILQSMQLHEIAKGESIKRYFAVLSVEEIKLSKHLTPVRLLQRNEEVAISSPRDICGDFFLAKERKGGDRFWEREFLYWLVSMKDGSRKLLYKSKKGNAYFWLSPNGHYLVQFTDSNYYCSYNLKTGHKINISRYVKTNLSVKSQHYAGYELAIPVGLGGWIDEDRILVYDNYDIWKLDLSGKNDPVNVTDYYGYKNKIKVRIIDEGNDFKSNDTVLLSVFNPANKFNGLYLLNLTSGKRVSNPVMGPWSIYYSHESSGVLVYLNSLLKPIKAKNANCWILRRESANESPNYFLTTDFKKLKPLTNLQPQAKYNWVRSELWHWSQPNGTTGQGILYKPENFNPSHKYPLIIYYYDYFSGRLHQYPTPEFMGSMHINIAWFVSRGYLVFTPDITYVKNKIVQSVCNTVISAGRSLALLPYIDGKSLGISGFSWGGVETNFLVSQTNIFAAVATGGAGMGADPISCALQLEESNGKITESYMEYVEGVLGSSFWDQQDLWLRLSPVINAGKIESPILMMNNYREGLRRWEGNVELFMALRRLNKRVWMLQYDKGGHGVFGKDREDFTIRITQFFDHFLKRMPMPKWMSTGVPAKLKGIEMGLNF